MDSQLKYKALAVTPTKYSSTEYFHCNNPLVFVLLILFSSYRRHHYFQMPCRLFFNLCQVGEYLVSLISHRKVGHVC